MKIKMERKKTGVDFSTILVSGKKFETDDFEYTIAKISGDKIETISKDKISGETITEEHTKKFLSGEFKKGNLREKKDDAEIENPAAIKNNNVEESISDQEFTDFTDKGIVNDLRIEDLARKHIKGEPLSKREQDIYSNNLEKIEKQLLIIKEKEEADRLEKENKTANEQNEVRNQINNTLDNDNKITEEKEVGQILKNLGLNEDDFSSAPAWKNFTAAEKLLILEQASQDTLSRVREIGEKRFEEKNTIKRSWNPTKWRMSAIEKTWHKMGKSFWISNEEKDVLKEVENGQLKPDEKVLNSLIERQADLGLSVVKKDGKAFIEFESTNKDLTVEQKTTIDRYNRVANSFAQMPDAWKNERSAKSTDKMFTKENHQKFEETREKYEKEKALLIESKVKQYEARGESETSAKEKAMMDVKDMDFKIAMLQFTNTNPDAVEELNKIRNESSWGRLINNENIWRSGYMAAGYSAKATFHSTIGFWTAPITAGIIGGIRARRKANENVNKAFNEGRKEETFLERKEKDKKGLFDDKNKNQNFAAYILQGEKVNTKEVAAFVDADSQKQRIDSLVSKINKSENSNEKVSLIMQLESRIQYIELKQEQGLINYGKENPVAKNYELLKTLSTAYAITTTIDNLGIPLTKEIKEDILERDALLASIMKKNEEKFGKKIARHKNEEMVRGAIVGAGFAYLGGKIRDWFHHDTEILHHTETPVKMPEIHHANTEITVRKGDGAIFMFRHLKKSLALKYGADIDKATPLEKHILNTDENHLAMENNMYKPGQNADSLRLQPGDKLVLDTDSQTLTFHEKIEGKDILLEKGTEIKTGNTYDEKMFDSHNSVIKHNTEGNITDDKYKLPPQVDPKTGEPEKLINSDSTSLDHTAKVNPLYKMPIQVHLGTGKPIGLENADGSELDHAGINSETNKLPKLVITETNEAGKPIHKLQKLIITETDANGVPLKTINPDVPKLNNIVTENIQTNVLSPEEILLVNSKVDESLKHIFPTEKLMGTWRSLNKDISADNLMEIKKEDVLEPFKPLISYMGKLKELSGLNPTPRTLINRAETIHEYMIRASQKIAEKASPEEDPLSDLKF